MYWSCYWWLLINCPVSFKESNTRPGLDFSFPYFFFFFCMAIQHQSLEGTTYQQFTLDLLGCRHHGGIRWATEKKGVRTALTRTLRIVVTWVRVWQTFWRHSPPPPPLPRSAMRPEFRSITWRHADVRRKPVITNHCAQISLHCSRN